MRNISDLKAAIRDVPDFPKKGIVFKDITPLLARQDLFREVTDRLAARYEDKGIRKVVGIESRGFLFATALAYKLGAGVVPVRKKGKLPWKTIQETYSLEYGTEVVEIHQDAVEKGENCLILDDVLATGGTAAAATRLVEKLGGKVAGLAFLIELTFLKGREKLPGRDIFSLIQY